jgi:site-specific DNA-methyltransferase (adenine-specific)
MGFNLMHGDCLEMMQLIPSESVDMVLADPPYGKTACKWDTVIDLPAMWAELKRVIKPNGAIVMTAIQPFTTTLINSNMKMFKYCWVWQKERPSNFFQAKFAPLNQFEDICVFSSGGCNNGSKNPMTYFPQGLQDIDVERGNSNTGGGVNINKGCQSLNGRKYKATKQGYPKSILVFSTEKRGGHPTQKPVALMEYLIRTYTNEGETVIDFTMGSGTTGVACVNTGRKFIGIELDQGYFDIAKKRIYGAISQSQEL